MNKRSRLVLGSLSVALLGGVGPRIASAADVEYWLQAVEYTRNVQQPVSPGTGFANIPVRMWQYRSCKPNFAECASTGDNTAFVLRAAAGDNLIVHLRNNLRSGGVRISLPGVAAYGGQPVPTSFMLPGLPAPTYAAGAAAGACPSTPAEPTEVAGGGRIRSFTSEVANDATLANAVGTYCWTNLKPGTYLYQSGTHAAVQVQMGLYGALVVSDAAANCATSASAPKCAYPGVPHSTEVVAVFSEIDPALHAKVADRSYGDGAAANPMTSTVFYEPRYFFLEGDSVLQAESVQFKSRATVAAGIVGQSVLLRMVNAGIENHAPMLLGERFTPVAEDANPYPASATYELHPQYSTLLPAGKTLDALVVPAQAGVYALIDRQRGLAGASNSSGGTNSAGMMVKLSIQ